MHRISFRKPEVIPGFGGACTYIDVDGIELDNGFLRTTAVVEMVNELRGERTAVRGRLLIPGHIVSAIVESEPVPAAAPQQPASGAGKAK